MNNLTKSVLIANKVLGLLFGSQFTTPYEQTIQDYPEIFFLK